MGWILATLSAMTTTTNKSTIFSNPATLSICRTLLSSNDTGFGEPWHLSGNMDVRRAPIPSGLSALVTVNPLPLPCVTFPTPITDPQQPHAPHHVIHTHTYTLSLMYTQTQVQTRVGPFASRTWCWGVIIVVYCKRCPECVWKPCEAEKDIRVARDNSGTAAETKRGSVTAEGCFIRMYGSIVHLHKGQRTLGVNFPWHAATNFRVEALYGAITPKHPSLTRVCLPFYRDEEGNKLLAKHFLWIKLKYDVRVATLTWYQGLDAGLGLQLATTFTVD